MKKFLPLLLLLLFLPFVAKAEVRMMDIYSETTEWSKIHFGFETIFAINRKDYIIFRQLCGNNDDYKPEYKKAINFLQKIKRIDKNFGAKRQKSSDKKIFVKRVYYNKNISSIKLLGAIEVEIEQNSFDIKKVTFTKKVKLDKETLKELQAKDIPFTPVPPPLPEEKLVVNYEKKEVYYASAGEFLWDSTRTNFPVRISEMYIGRDSLGYNFSEPRFQKIEEIHLHYFSLKNSRINKDSEYSFINQLPKLSGLKSLIISGPAVDELPKSIGDLENLESLVVKCRNLRTIPEEILNLKKLSNVSISSHSGPFSEESKFIYYKLRRQVAGKRPIIPKIKNFTSNTPMEKIKRSSLFDHEFLKSSEFIIAFSNSCSSQNNYVISFKNNQWEVMKITAQYNYDEQKGDYDITAEKESFEVEEDKIGFLLYNLYMNNFWNLDVEQISNTKEELSSGGVTYHYLSDGCAERVNIYYQGKHRDYYADMPRYLQSIIPNDDRQKFITCVEEIWKIFSPFIK